MHTDQARTTLRLANAATLLVLINFTAPMTTLGTIAGDLNASPAGQTWILSSITLGLAALLLVSGTLADDYGRKRVFVLGAAGLAVATLVCATAPTTLAFVIGRIIQGGASAALLTASLGLIGHAFPAGKARTRATGMWGAMVGGGIAIGPILAAGLTQSLNWQSAYWVIAAAAAVLAIAARRLTESKADTPSRFDLPGVLTLGTGLAFLVAALIEGRGGWTQAHVLAFFAIAAVLVLSFVAIENRRTAPMLDLGLFRQPTFIAATTGAMITGLAIIGPMSNLPSLLQRLLGQSSLATAGIFGIWSGMSFITALQARRLATRLSGRHQLVVGFLLAAIGEVALLGLSANSSWYQLVPGLVINGIGSGLINAALGRLAVESVPPGRAAVGSGANNTARYVGSAIGIAGAAAIIASGINLALIVCAAVALLGALIATLSRPATASSPVVASHPATSPLR